MSSFRVATSACLERSGPSGVAAATAPALPAAELRQARGARPGDEFFRALGRLTASFAALEHQLQVLAGLLISRTDQELGRIVTADLPFGKLVDLASALARYRLGDEPDQRELRALLVRAATVGERRSCVTHSEWGPGSVAETRLRVKMALRGNDGLRLERQGMTAAEVDALAAEASAIAAEVSRAWARLSHERRFRGMVG